MLNIKLKVGTIVKVGEPKHTHTYVIAGTGRDADGCTNEATLINTSSWMSYSSDGVHIRNPHNISESEFLLMTEGSRSFRVEVPVVTEDEEMEGQI